ARAPARYRGEQEPIDPVAGHIPGASNRFNGDNLKPDATFKDAQTLRTEFLQVLGKRQPAEVVHYCVSGVAACHNLLAMEIGGVRPESFVARWVQRLLYYRAPEWAFTTGYVLWTLATLLTLWLVPPRRKAA